ncbi:hypothetical protein KSP39_PZI018981 [Platanthera zijinensis]|uniref:Uncharacterized protein n=1 Tax=Platanthera zijinensis TaxID=2320716 RepID=A0AAP0B2W3_9ASPA
MDRGSSVPEQPKSIAFKADGLAISEQKRHVMFDVEATTSLGAQECFSMEKCINMKHRKTKGIQTDIVHDSNKQGVASKLQAIWGLCEKRSGNYLVTKLLETCSEDFFALFRCINMPSNCNLSGLPNESFFEMTFPDNTQSAHSNGAAKASRFYQSLMKMRCEIVPLQVVIDALLDLCNHDNDIFNRSDDGSGTPRVAGELVAEFAGEGKTVDGGRGGAARAAAPLAVPSAEEGGGPGGRSRGRAGGRGRGRPGRPLPWRRRRPREGAAWAAGGQGGGRPPAAGEVELVAVCPLRMMGSVRGGSGAVIACAVNPLIPLLLRWRSWVTVAHVSLRILHATLQHLDFDYTIQR